MCHHRPNQETSAMFRESKTRELHQDAMAEEVQAPVCVMYVQKIEHATLDTYHK